MGRTQTRKCSGFSLVFQGLPDLKFSFGGVNQCSKFDFTKDSAHVPANFHEHWSKFRHFLQVQVVQGLFSIGTKWFSYHSSDLKFWGFEICKIWVELSPWQLAFYRYKIVNRQDGTIVIQFTQPPCDIQCKWGKAWCWVVYKGRDNKCIVG